MYVVLAWFNVAFIAVMLMPYLMKKLGKSQMKKNGFRKALKAFRTIHRPLGALVLIVGGTHGYLALGGILRLNTTGTLLWGVLIITGVFGGTYAMSKNRTVFKIHKFMALMVVVSFFYHYLMPGPVI